ALRGRRRRRPPEPTPTAATTSRSSSGSSTHAPCLSVARKLCRRTCHILRELGEQALAPVEQAGGEEAGGPAHHAQRTPVTKMLCGRLTQAPPPGAGVGPAWPEGHPVLSPLRPRRGAGRA